MWCKVESVDAVQEMVCRGKLASVLAEELGILDCALVSTEVAALLLDGDLHNGGREDMDWLRKILVMHCGWR